MLAGIHRKNVEEKESRIHLRTAYQNVGQILKKNMLDKMICELQVSISSLIPPSNSLYMVHGLTNGQMV